MDETGNMTETETVTEVAMPLTFSDPQAFGAAVKAVCVAAGKDNGRPILASVLIEPIETGVRLVATDSYRLHYADVELDAEAREVASTMFAGGVMVDAKTLVEVAKLATVRGCIMVQVAITDRQIRFSTFDRSIEGRLEEGTFPAYRQLIPSELAPCTDVVAFDPRRLADIGKAVALLRKDLPVRLLHTKDGGVTVWEAYESKLGVTLTVLLMSARLG